MTDDEDTVIEIHVGTAADPQFSDYGQRKFLVILNESGKEDEGTIWWDGTSREEAWEVARELADDYEAPIIDLVPTIH
jgi:hypothetical protein